MPGEKIFQLPAATPLTGAEQVPMWQAGETVQATTLQISALFTPVAGPPGPPGPTGPTGPAGPTGPPYTPNITIVNATYAVLATDDIVVVDSASGAGSINLPPAASFPAKLLWVKRADFGSGFAWTVTPNGIELFDGGLGAMTLYSAGSGAGFPTGFILYPKAGGWYVLGVGPNS